MAYNPSDPNYYVNVSDPCGQDLANYQQQACGNAQKAYADQQTGQIPTLAMQQEKLGYLKEVGQAGMSGGITSAGLGYGAYIGDPLPQPIPKSCPCCGYCPHCGRSNQTPTYYPVCPSITYTTPVQPGNWQMGTLTKQ